MQFSKETTFNIWYWVAALFGADAVPVCFRPRPRKSRRSPIASSRLISRKAGSRRWRYQTVHPGRTSRSRVDGRPMFITTRVEPDLARDACGTWRRRHRSDRKHVSARSACHGLSLLALFFGLWMFILRRMGRKHGRRADADRQEQGQGLCRDAIPA